MPKRDSKKDLTPSVLKSLTLKDNSNSDSDLTKTSELLMNEKWRRRKTIIRDRANASLSTLDTIAQIYDIEFLKTWIEAYTEYSTSVQGKGRKDIVDIAKFSIERRDAQKDEVMQLLGKR